MNTIDPHKNPKLLWTSREAAAAMNISERTLWTLAHDGQIPVLRIGRCVRYSPADIQAWIVANKSFAKGPESPGELP
jgi:excisionase family DNA binding protein